MTIGKAKIIIKTKVKNQAKRTKFIRNTFPCAVKLSVKKAMENLQGKDSLFTSLFIFAARKRN